MASMKAEIRTGTGSRKASALRKAGKVPGILYGHGQPTQSLVLDKHDVKKAMAHGERLLKVELEGKVENALLKEVQYDHLGSDILHLDLARVDLDEVVEVTVPIVLRGTPIGATEGGVLQQVLAETTIAVMVRSIPDDLRVSVEAMKVGAHLLLKDLPLPEGAKLLADADTIVATVSVVAEEAAAEGAEVAAPEVIGEKKEEEEAGEAKK